MQKGRQTHSGGEANGHGWFGTGTQTHTVQPGTQEQIPDTFLGFADHFTAVVVWNVHRYLKIVWQTDSEL